MKPYVPLSTDFFSDDKVIELMEQEPMAVLTFIGCLTVAKRSERDGRVTLAQVRRELPGLDHEPLLKTLVESRLIEQEDERTFIVKAWLGWNKPAAELEKMRADKVAAGRSGGRQSGAVRRAKSSSSHAVSKQSASVNGSSVLHDAEADGEPKRNLTSPQDEDENHPNPVQAIDAARELLLPSLAGVVATQRENGVVDLERGTRIVARVIKLCKARNRERVNAEAAELVAWASTALDLRCIEEVIGTAEAAPTQPSFPVFLAKPLQRRASSARVPLADFVTTNKGAN